MSVYNYSPLLETPQQMPDIDPAQPAMKVMLKIMTRTKMKETEAFKAPDGVTVRKEQAVSADGNTFDTWIVEPEQSEEITDAMLYIHGGAFYLPVTTDSLKLACEYARRMKIRVYLPEYRLVPAYRAPYAFHDCLALWNSISEQNYKNLFVLGESAGGALAAGLCLYLRDEGLALPDGQLLIYPVLDDQFENNQSAVKYSEAVWNSSANRKMWNAYLDGAGEADLPYLVPMRHADLCSLPPSYIEPQEIDILCDEALKYAARLKEAGVITELNLIEQSFHCFDTQLDSEPVSKALERRTAAIERMRKK